MGVIRGFGLNPCPICGSRSIEIQDGQTMISVNGPKAMTARVRCRDCRFKTDYQYDRDTAKSVWNSYESKSPKYTVRCFIEVEGTDRILPRSGFDRVVDSARNAMDYMVETSECINDGKGCLFKVEVKR